MIPVMQTIHTAPGGNCFQASVASILDLPIEAVPHFFEKSDGGNWTQDEWDAVRAFADQQGYRACWIDPQAEPDLHALLLASELHYVAIGPSPRSAFGHCVVMRAGAFIHDPFDGQEFIGAPWLCVVFEQAGQRAASHVTQGEP